MVTILVLIALVCFALAALSVPTGRVSMLGAGAFFALLAVSMPALLALGN